MSVEIITNNVPRDIVQAWELTESERAEFDYLNWSEIESGEGTREFARYRGELYDLEDTEGCFPEDRRWFYVSDSFFSGVLFRYPVGDYGPDSIDTDRVICGRYYVKG